MSLKPECCIRGNIRPVLFSFPGYLVVFIDSSFCNLCVDYVVLSILKGGIIIFRCKSEKKIDWDTNILWLVSLFIKEFPKSTLRVSYRGGIIWQAKILHMICIIGCIFIYMFYVIQQKWDYISEILISIQKVL